MESTNPITSYQYFIASPYFAGFTNLGATDSKLFIDSYTKSPESIKNFISSDETATMISLAGIKYELQDSQVSNIAQLLRELLLGKIFIKDFPSTLASKLAVDESKAVEITNYIVSQSFAPITEDLKRIQRSKFPDKIMQLQKEARPEGLNKVSTTPQPKTSIPTQPTQTQIRPPVVQGQTRPVIPAAPSAPKPSSSPLPPQSQQVRPPLQMPPRPSPSPSQPQAPVQPAQQPIQAPSQPGSNAPSPQSQPKPAPTLPPKPVFKIPDLGDIVKKDGSNQSSNAQKSLEAELEKVANVIDLRNNQNNKQE